MRFFGWLYALVAGALFLWFAALNWTPVTVNLSGEAFVQPALPLLVLAGFLLGFAPMWLVWRLSRWRWSRRLSRSEKRMADWALDHDGRAASARLSPEQTEAAILARSRAARQAGGYDDLPPQASPMAVPPAG